MSAADLLHTLHRIGAVVTVEEGDLLIDAVADLPTALLVDLSAHKLQLIALLTPGAANDQGSGESTAPKVFTREPAPNAMAEDWQERSAIIQFDAGFTHRDAQQAAWRSVYCSRCVHAAKYGCQLHLVSLHCGKWSFAPRVA